MSITLLCLGIFFGVLTARAGTIADRGGIQQTNTAIILIGFGAMVSTFAIMIWGFISFSWWIPLIAFIPISLLVGLLVGPANWVIFYRATPVTGLIAIGVTTIAWLS